MVEARRIELRSILNPLEASTSLVCNQISSLGWLTNMRAQLQLVQSFLLAYQLRQAEHSPELRLAGGGEKHLVDVAALLGGECVLLFAN